MMPRSNPAVYLTSLAYDDLKRLPGNVRRQPIILGIRRRPPYDYQDIQRLLEDVDQ